MFMIKNLILIELNVLFYAQLGSPPLTAENKLGRNPISIKIEYKEAVKNKSNG